MSRLFQDGMRLLLREIAGGTPPEGGWLPRVVDLAHRLDASSGTAREIIRALEERGVVAVRHGRGARVLPVEEWDVLDPEVLAALLERREGREVVDEALECRRLLEGEAAALAARRIDPAGARTLTEAFERMRAAASDERTPGQLADAATSFREAVATRAGNRPMRRMLSPLAAVDAAAITRLNRAGRNRLVERYEALLSAVCAGDADAARAAVEADVAAIARAVAGPARQAG